MFGYLQRHLQGLLNPQNFFLGLFVLTVSTMEDPPKPFEDPDFFSVNLVDDDTILPVEMASRNHIPTLEEMGVEEDVAGQKESYIWQGGLSRDKRSIQKTIEHCVM